MPKRISKKAPKATKTTDPADRLRRALVKRTKSELIDLLVDLARDDRRLFRSLAGRFELKAGYVHQKGHQGGGGVGIQAVKTCDLPASQVAVWCGDMLKSDRVDFICDRELRALREQFEPHQPQ